MRAGPTPRTTPDWSLAGATALVTGGASGIGRAVAVDLLALGARVLVADIDHRALAQTGQEIDVETHCVDLTSDDELEQLAATSRAAGCSILVNNAGASLVEPFVGSDPVGWDHLYRLNQRAPMRLTQLLLPGMVKRGSGRVVHVSSDVARAGSSGEAAYAATKAALLGFSKSVAREVARTGVTSNVVCPGPIRTPMVEEGLRDQPGLRERLERIIPMKRFGEPEEVSAAVAWLVSPRSSYVTGQVISVSGGATMQ